MQAFRKTYGKILELTIAEVSIEAIASLTQYYDQPLRCLRRSKRRNIQPERYSDCGNVSEIKVGNVRTWPYKLNKRKDDDDNEEPLPLAQENGGNSQKVRK